MRLSAISQSALKVVMYTMISNTHQKATHHVSLGLKSLMLHSDMHKLGTQCNVKPLTAVRYTYCYSI